MRRSLPFSLILILLLLLSLGIARNAAAFTGPGEEGDLSSYDARLSTGQLLAASMAPR